MTCRSSSTHKLGKGRVGHFALQDALSNSAFRGAAADAATYRSLTLAKRGDAGDLSPTPIVQHDSGSVLRDFIWISLVPLIHERVAELWERAGITGWTTYSVAVYDRGRRNVPGYLGLSAIGRCTSVRIDSAHSEVVYEERPTGLYPYYKGLHVDGWDGSDLFMAADMRSDLILVTDRTRRSLLKHKVNNIRISSVSDFTMKAMDLPATP